MDVNASFARWLAALAAPHDQALVVAAVTDGARVERHGAMERGAEPGPPAEVIEGVDAVGRWLRMLPPRVTWSVVGDAVADGDAWRIEYALEVNGFENGGVWIARFADDGRLAYLSHRPFPVPDKWRR